jgi:hypothetical protein
MRRATNRFNACQRRGTCTVVDAETPHRAHIGNARAEPATDKAQLMAQKVTVQLVDDLDQSPISEGEGRTVQFGFDGSDYEIDLSNDNADKLRDALSDYIAAARKTAGRRSGATGGTKSPSKRGNAEELGKIREWAKENGYEVSSRGRISTQVQEAYAAAH